MKGIIAYSSHTGNTKRVAERLFQKIKEQGFELDIKHLEEDKNVDIDAYDYALVGAWIDRAKPNALAAKLLKNSKQKNLGIFITMGADIHSNHGKEVEQNLEKILSDRNSLGAYLAQGIVHSALLNKLKTGIGFLMPEKIKQQMIESSEKSREATEEEIDEIADAIISKLKAL